LGVAATGASSSLSPLPFPFPLRFVSPLPRLSRFPLLRVISSLFFVVSLFVWVFSSLSLSGPSSSPLPGPPSSSFSQFSSYSPWPSSSSSFPLLFISPCALDFFVVVSSQPPPTPRPPHPRLPIIVDSRRHIRGGSQGRYGSLLLLRVVARSHRGSVLRRWWWPWSLSR